MSHKMKHSREDLLDKPSEHHNLVRWGAVVKELPKEILTVYHNVRLVLLPQWVWQNIYCNLQSKFQEPVNENIPFPCDTQPRSPGARSVNRPNTVHRLRPGDIDVIGAMGDSLTAGTGSAAENLVELFIENRGMSWSGGEFASRFTGTNLMVLSCALLARGRSLAQATKCEF
jgi:hypothetical protein